MWMIIHIDVFLFATPYKRDIPLIKIYLVILLHSIILLFKYLYLLSLIFIIFILLFYNIT